MSASVTSIRSTANDKMTNAKAPRTCRIEQHTLTLLAAGQRLGDEHRAVARHGRPDVDRGAIRAQHAQARRLGGIGGAEKREYKEKDRDGDEEGGARHGQRASKCVTTPTDALT